MADSDRLFLEVRHPENRIVSFSCVDLRSERWLLEDKSFDEPWWTSLAAASGNILLLTVYTGTDNPDKKSLVAFDVEKKEIIWWQHAFSPDVTTRHFVTGKDSRRPGHEVVLDIFTGKPVQPADFHLEDSQNFTVIRPFQYQDGTSHFATVRDFLQSRMGISTFRHIEYLETDSLIITSVFIQENELANYLMVFDTDGDLLLHEKLGENLKGIALDTFFIFSDHLVFIKEKNEFRGYKIL